MTDSSPQPRLSSQLRSVLKAKFKLFFVRLIPSIAFHFIRYFLLVLTMFSGIASAFTFVHLKLLKENSSNITSNYAMNLPAFIVFGEMSSIVFEIALIG